MSARFLGYAQPMRHLWNLAHRRSRPTCSEFQVRDGAGRFVVAHQSRAAAERHIERWLADDPGAEIGEVWK